MSNQTPFCVLVTRPAQQGRALCDFLDENGYKAIHCPTIAFAPPRQPEQWQEAVSHFGEQDWLIFISPQAVRASVQDLPPLPNTVKIAAVGKGTADALTAHGLTVSLYPDDDWGGDGLLALMPLQNVQQQKIAIIRGEGGREHLSQQLTSRGATVLEAMAYQRVLPTVSMAPYQALLDQGKRHAIICTSYEGVRNLKTLLGASHWLDLQQQPLIVVSERIKKLASDLGFQTIWVAENASNEALLAVLKAI